VLFSYDFMARHGGMRPGASYLLAVRDRAFSRSGSAINR